MPNYNGYNEISLNLPQQEAVFTFDILKDIINEKDKTLILKIFDKELKHYKFFNTPINNIISIFIDDNILFKKKRRIIIDLIDSKFYDKDLYFFLSEFIIKSKKSGYLSYLYHFINNDIINSLKGNIIEDVKNYKFYIPILINFSCIDLLNNILIAYDSIEKDEIYRDLLKGLYSLTRDLQFLKLLKLHSVSRFLEYCYKQNISRDIINLKKIVETLNLSNEDLKWQIYWILKIDFTFLPTIMNCLAKSSVNFHSLFKDLSSYTDFFDDKCI